MVLGRLVALRELRRLLLVFGRRLYLRVRVTRIGLYRRIGMGL
jgi:hypothetical protein